MSRTATVHRKTTETEVTVTLGLDAAGPIEISTGLGILDHMLTALAKHAGFACTLACRGDLHVDDHHTVEDCALTLGQALDQCLGDRHGIARFGSAYAPLDESLARVVVDLSGRPHAAVNLTFARDMVGDVATENLTHFFVSLAMASRSCLHVDILRGSNDHHKAESAFKALALALREAVAVRNPGAGSPSTKGVL